MKTPKNMTARLSDIRALVGVLVVASFLLGGAGVASAAAPAERPEVDNAETHLAELQTRLEQRKSQRERLETEAMADLQNRLHRMAYEKYRDLDSLIVEDLGTLSELKRRTPELVVRARAAQQMEDLRTAQQSVRRMMSLLRVHTYGSRG